MQLFSGVDGSLLRTITSTTENEELGFDAVGIGDTNGDGIPDLLVSRRTGQRGLRDRRHPAVVRPGRNPAQPKSWLAQTKKLVGRGAGVGVPGTPRIRPLRGLCVSAAWGKVRRVAAGSAPEGRWRCKSPPIRPAGACAALALLAVFGATSTAAAAPGRPPAPPVFSFSGHGYGHGVGLRSTARTRWPRKGSTAAQILQRYYPGTQLAAAPSSTLRVLVQQTAKTVAVHAAAPLHLRDANGQTADVPPGQSVTITRTGTTFDVTGAGRHPDAGWAAPVTVNTGGAAPIVVEGNAPAGGTAAPTAAPPGARRRGVRRRGRRCRRWTTREGRGRRRDASSWPSAALESQAIAARSYALAGAGKGTRPYDVFADTRSQVYGGVYSEAAASTAAVDATAGQVVEYAGQVATTYFSSSDGGFTADPVEAGPHPEAGALPAGHARPRRRRLAVPRLERHDRRRRRREGPRLRRHDHLDGHPGVPVGPGADPQSTAAPARYSIPGPTARLKLGLRSTWFALQAPLTLAAPKVTGPEGAAEGQRARRGRRAAGREGRQLADDHHEDRRRRLGLVQPAARRGRPLPAPDRQRRVQRGQGLGGHGPVPQGAARLELPGPPVPRRGRPHRAPAAPPPQGLVDGQQGRTGVGGVLRFATKVGAGIWRAHFQGDGILRASSSGQARPARTQQSVRTVQRVSSRATAAPMSSRSRSTTRSTRGSGT